MGRRRNFSRAPRASAASARNRAFIIDMVTQGGRRFVTSVSTLSAIKPAIQKHGGQTATVSHWEQVAVYSDHPMDGWQLVERFPL